MLSAVLIYLLASVFTHAEGSGVCTIREKCKEYKGKERIYEHAGYKLVIEHQERVNELSPGWDNKKCENYGCLLPAMEAALASAPRNRWQDSTRGSGYAYCKKNKSGKWRQETNRMRRRSKPCVDKKHVAVIADALKEVGKCVGIEPFSILPLLIHESRIGLNAQSGARASCLGQLTGVAIADVNKKYFGERTPVENKRGKVPDRKSTDFIQRFSTNSECKNTRDKIRKNEEYANFPFLPNEHFPTYWSDNDQIHKFNTDEPRFRCAFIDNPYLCLLYSTLYFKKNSDRAAAHLKKCQKKIDGFRGKKAKEIADWLKPEDQKFTYSLNKKTNVELKAQTLLGTWAHNVGGELFGYVDSYCNRIVRALRRGKKVKNDVQNEVRDIAEKKRKKDDRSATEEYIVKTHGESSELLGILKKYKTLEAFMNHIKSLNKKAYAGVQKVVKGKINRTREILGYIESTIEDGYQYLKPDNYIYGNVDSVRADKQSQSCQEKIGWLSFNPSGGSAGGNAKGGSRGN